MAKRIGEWFRAFLGVAFAAAWALGGSPSTAAPLQLVTDQWIPYENLSDGEAPGFSTEVLKQVFTTMGREASFEEFPWARAAGLVFRGERDAIFTAFRSDERERFCHFPKEPLARDKWVFFVRAADAGKLKFSSFDDLVGHDIAVLRGAAVSPESSSSMPPTRLTAFRGAARSLNTQGEDTGSRAQRAVRPIRLD